MTQSGIGNDTTVVLYGDNNNWFAAWAFWQMKIYGHKDVRIMDGGRKKWLAEGRDLDTAATKPVAGAQPYQATEPDYSLRAFLPQVQQAQKSASAVMIDVRSPQEFTGEILAPPGLPETCQRGGHIPGARSVPWGKACNDDGTFKSAGRTRKSSMAPKASCQSKPVIAYCRIGERSSHTWFVLKYLLGVNNVMNYDGSWTEWGNLVGAPVEKGAAKAGASVKPENFSERKVDVDGWQVNLTTYQLGDKWHTKADNVSPGAALARIVADTREDAEVARSGARQRAALENQTSQHF